jgi:hypothetical protein
MSLSLANNNLCYVGIDVGVKGAVAVITGRQVELFDTPAFKTKEKGKSRSQYSLLEMVPILRDLPVRPTVVVIEDPGFITAGKLALASLQRGLGYWQAICATLNYPVDTVKPWGWKSRILVGRVPQGLFADKEAIKYSAHELFPEIAHLITTPDRAEALYMALYGKLKWGEGNVLRNSQDDVSRASTTTDT